MDKQTFHQHPHRLSQSQVEMALAEWMDEMYRFHMHYKTLTTYANCNHIGHSVKREGAIYIGQCPVDQLESLIGNMHNALQQLFDQTGNIDTTGFKDAKIDHEMIVKHTAILKQLNEEAKMKLCLVSLPAS